MFQGDNKRQSRVLRPHPQEERKEKYAPCPKSSNYSYQRDLLEKDTQQKLNNNRTQTKYHDITQALSICVLKIEVC